MGFFSNISKGVSNLGKSIEKTANAAVGNVGSRAEQFAGGVRDVASGDLRGVQDIFGAPVNLTSDLYGNATGLQNAAVDAAFSPLKDTPLYGLTAGNIKGLNSTVEGILRGNLAGIQDLPTDVGKAVQSGLDAGKDLVESLGDALGGLMGGGAGGAGGGAEVLQSLRNLANQSADYASNLPSEFQAFEGDRFAAPSDRTTAAETALYNQQGSNIQGAYDLTNRLTGKAENSGFSSNIAAAQNYAPVGLQTERNFSNASNAGSRNYTGMDVQAGPTAGAQEFNATTYNPAGPNIAPDRYTGQTFEGANYNPAAIASTGRDRSGDALQFEGQQYGNAVNAQAQDYQSGNTFAQDMAQYQNPYNQSVIDASLEDLNRARMLADQQTDAQAIAAGAFGGSRAAQLEAQNFKNYLEQAGRLSSQMRQQGFNTAAQLASQDRAQRLGLTAEAQQQAQQLGSQGALQGQSLTAGDLQAARDASLRSQLQTQQLGQQGDLQTQQLQAQAALQGQNLTAQSANQAQQLMAQSGMQGQQLTAQAREAANQLMQQRALQGQSLTAADLQQIRTLNQQSYDTAAQRALQSQLQAQQLGVQSGMQSQQLGADSYNLMQQLQNQGALQGQNLTASNLQTILNNNAAAQLQAQNLGADSFNQQQDRLLDQSRLAEQFRQSALSDALTGANNMGTMGQNLDTMQRQQLLDQLAVGQYQDQRNQQQLDFDYEQYQNEQAFPATYLDNLNRGGQLGLGIATATAAGSGGGGGGQRNPLAAMIGGGLSGFLATGNPWGAAAGAGMGLLGVNDQNSFAGLGKLLGDNDGDTTTTNFNMDTPKYSAPTTGGAAAGGRSAGRGGGRALGDGSAAAAPVAQNASPLAGKASGFAGGLFGSGTGGFGGGMIGNIQKSMQGALNNATAQPNQQQPISSNKQFTLPNGNVVGTGLKLGPLGGFGGFGGFGMV